MNLTVLSEVRATFTVIVCLRPFLGGVLFVAWVVQAPIRHYTIGKEIVDLVLDRIRKLADNCTGRETASSVRFVVYFGIIITYIFGC